MFGKFFESLFFSTDSRSYWKPEHYGLKGVGFKSKTVSGHEIDGLVLQPKGAAAADGALIMFFHAAKFNREFNLPQAAFFAMKGYRVVLFDYSGCGMSDGDTTLDGLLKDGEAVLSWLDASEFSNKKLILFAQGIGCDAALQLCDAHKDRVLGLILESPYASRKGWAKDRWGPVLGDIAAHGLEYQAREPEEILSELEIPAVILFPEKDTFIHSQQRKAVIAAASDKVEIWKVPKLRFLGIFGGAENEWHRAVLKWTGKLVKGPTKKSKTQEAGKSSQ